MRALVLFAVIASVRIAGLDESSGLAPSRRFPGVFWTMNDGSSPYLYAFDRKGSLKGRIEVKGPRLVDLEALSTGPGPENGEPYLYAGDTGDNLRRRNSITVYRLREPELTVNGVSTGLEAFHFTYPDGRHDAEALMVHPGTGDLYIVSKARVDDPITRVYKATAPLASERVTRLQHIAAVEFPGESVWSLLVGRVTGGDISPDGNRVVLCDYIRGWEAEAPPGNFDAVWRAKWRPIDLGDRKQGEAVAYRHDGKTILATSEGDEFPLIEVNASPSTIVR
jgi:hypothetical protein